MFEQFISNFSAGVVSPEVYGRFDSELYKNALKRVQNFICLTQGAALFRGGSTYMHPTRQNKVARIERFRYDDEEVYVLEFTDGKLRIYEDKALTLDSTAKNITGATKANPCAITCVGHGYATGDEIYIAAVGGMTQLNGRFFRIVKTSNDSFTLKDLFGNDVNSSAFTTYTAGGTATIVYEVTSPYSEANLDTFQFDQEGNIAYFVSDLYAPYKLTRVSATSWTFATYSRTSDPFTGSGKYPRAVCFFEGCLYFAGSVDNPNRVWRSRGPDDTGATRHDDFTTGSDADHAIIFNLTAVQGEVAYIHWIEGLSDFIAFGTEGGIIGVDGGGDAAITPTNYRVRPIDPVGVQGISPVTNGQTIFYMQKGSRVLRSFEYDLVADRYQSFDRSFLAPHLTKGGITKIAIQRWKIDLLWAVRADGTLLGLTIKPKEDVSGWHVHPFTDGKVIDILVEPQVQGYDRLYVVVERTINSVTTRYIEYLNDPWEGLDQNDYYTGDQTTDETAYQNAVFSELASVVYLDGSLSWTGTATTTITGLWHWEGETIQVMADGRKHSDVTVTNGIITLTRNATAVVAGKKYRGILIPLNLIVAGQMQNSISFAKNVSTVALTVANTIGVRYGTSLYELNEIYASEEGQLTDTPPLPRTGTITLPVADTWTADKSLVYVQDDPYPCMLNAMNITIEVGEK
jgi:hypothetical protein